MPVATRQPRLTQLLQWTVTLLVSAAIIAVLYSRRDELAALVELTPGLLVAVSIAALAQFAAQGLVLKFMFEHFRARLSLAEAIIVGLMDATLNYLPMKAGTVATGAVAVKRYAIRVTEYAAGVAGATVVNVWVCGVLSGLLLVPTRLGLGLALMLAPSLVVLSLLLWGRSHAEAPTEGSRFRQALLRAARGLQSIYADHGLLTRLVLANVVRLIAVSAQLYFSFRAVSTPISVSDAIIIGGFATVLGRLSIIPGGLGFREGGVVAAAALVGIDPTVALAASVIDRAVIMLWLAVLGLPSTMYVSRTTAWHRAASELPCGEGASARRIHDARDDEQPWACGQRIRQVRNAQPGRSTPHGAVPNRPRRDQADRWPGEPTRCRVRRRGAHERVGGHVPRRPTGGRRSRRHSAPGAVGADRSTESLVRLCVCDRPALRRR